MTSFPERNREDDFSLNLNELSNNDVNSLCQAGGPLGPRAFMFLNFLVFFLVVFCLLFPFIFPFLSFNFILTIWFCFLTVVILPKNK